MAQERAGQSPIFEVITPITIDERFIDRYEHLWHLGSLALFEEERYRILESKGISSEIIQSEFGLRVLVAKMKDVEWLGEVHQGDEVKIRSLIENSRAIMFVHQEMSKEELAVVKANYVLAFVDSEGKPRRIPNEVLDRLYRQNS